MATYTADQLSGTGTPIEALSSGSTYTFNLTGSAPLSGSAYFTFETLRGINGYYNSSSITAAKGTHAITSGVLTFVGSDYIFSYVVEQGGGIFTFEPSQTVPASGSYLRATGGLSLVIS